MSSQSEPEETAPITGAAVTGSSIPSQNDPYATSTEPEQAAPGAGTKARTTNTARVWVAIAVAAILLILLIIFIAENSRSVTISFLGANGTISLGLALLIAAVAGIVITLLVGSARIFQLRREVRRRGGRSPRGRHTGRAVAH